MTSRYILVVSLWIHPGQEEAFEAFERDAAQLMAKHGGRIDSAIRIEPDLTPPAEEGPPPHEVHIVSFPNLTAAGAYATDPETVELRERRPAIISRTELLAGWTAGPY